MCTELNAVIDNIRVNRDFIKSIDRNIIISIIFNILYLTWFALSMTPFMKKESGVPSIHPKKNIAVNINGVLNRDRQWVPQIVYKIPLNFHRFC